MNVHQIEEIGLIAGNPSENQGSGWSMFTYIYIYIYIRYHWTDQPLLKYLCLSSVYMYICMVPTETRIAASSCSTFSSPVGVTFLATGPRYGSQSAHQKYQIEEIDEMQTYIYGYMIIYIYIWYIYVIEGPRFFSLYIYIYMFCIRKPCMALLPWKQFTAFGCPPFSYLSPPFSPARGVQFK